MEEDKKNPITEPGDRGCDIKVWSESCERSDYTTDTEKYQCALCGKITKLEHEVHHEHFPHVSGDKDNLS